MLSSEGDAGERWKTTIGLISKKATLHGHAAHFFCTSLCRCFGRLQRENSRNLLVTRFLEEMSCVFSFTFFFTATHFTLHRWPLAFLILSLPVQKMLFFQPKNVSFAFFSLTLAGLRTTFSFSLSFSYSVFQISGHDNLSKLTLHTMDTETISAFRFCLS